MGLRNEGGLCKHGSTSADVAPFGRGGGIVIITSTSCHTTWRPSFSCFSLAVPPEMLCAFFAKSRDCFCYGSEVPTYPVVFWSCKLLMHTVCPCRDCHVQSCS